MQMCGRKREQGQCCGSLGEEDKGSGDSQEDMEAVGGAGGQRDREDRDVPGGKQAT